MALTGAHAVGDHGSVSDDNLRDNAIAALAAALAGKLDTTVASSTYAPTIGAAAYLFDLAWITGPFVTGQLSTPTTLTAQATAGATTIAVTSGASFPNNTILNTNWGTATAAQYKVTAGGGTTTLTVTPAIVTTLASGSSIQALWIDLAHMNEWTDLAYRLTHATRPDGTPLIQDPGSKPIVLLGNSWFAGGGAAIAAAIVALYPAATVINKGNVGERSDQLLARFDTDVASNAAYVIINEPGVNDVSSQGALISRDKSVANLEAMIVKTRALGATAIVFGTPPLWTNPALSAEYGTLMRGLLSSPTTYPTVTLGTLIKSVVPSRVPEAGSVALGINVLGRLTTGIANCGIGGGAQLNVTTSSGNTAVGNTSMQALTTGSGNNVAVGGNSMYPATTAFWCVGVGSGALYNPNGVVANGTLAASEVTAVGYQSGASDATDPSGLTAVGKAAIAATLAVAIGARAVASGASSIAIGRSASATAAGSVAIGRSSDNAVATSTVADDFVLGTALHKVKIAGRLNVAQRTPTSGADTQGAVGDIVADDNYVYAKTSTGWKRSAITTW